jgi:hypothetical protein
MEEMARHAQAFKGLWAGHFVNQMAVNVEDGRAIVFGVDDVFVPDLVVKRASHEGFLDSLNRIWHFIR